MPSAGETVRSTDVSLQKNEELWYCVCHALFSPAADGHVILYEREVPCELRMQEGSKAPQDVGRLEPIRVKVLIMVSTFPDSHVHTQHNQADQKP